ncbi:MAG: arginyl-tRNA--protein transferase [Chitinophagaceae bacterium]|jgi:arginine-tRNA-protein transferase|nr:arginyl-tRNA--protein transferase [Chitinophagaceae bacterium]
MHVFVFILQPYSTICWVFQQGSFSFYLMIGKQEIYVDFTQQALDEYLARGWFRMGQRMFTTHYLFLDEKFFSAVWLRYRLAEELRPLLKKRIRKIAAEVEMHEGEWMHSAEQEALYEAYAAQSGLQLSPTLQQLLQGNRKHNAFSTRQLCFTKNGKLVGLGIFDKGLQTAAGIINCFSPVIKQYSPGKALMYSKMLSCMDQGISYFYPGYAVPGHSRFDYKLQIAPAYTEWYNPATQCWYRYEVDEPLPDWLNIQSHNLSELRQALLHRGISGKPVRYIYFDAALAGGTTQPTLQEPLLLYIILDSDAMLGLAATYNFTTNAYSLQLTNAIFDAFTQQWGQHCVYTDEIQVIQDLGKAKTAEALADIVTEVMATFAWYKAHGDLNDE